uniref:Uncharacterized protein n=1 Tax=Anopheles minimus TaxID=112268 RepID=A0A182WKF8_9DIPT
MSVFGVASIRPSVPTPIAHHHRELFHRWPQDNGTWWIGNRRRLVVPPLLLSTLGGSRLVRMLLGGCGAYITLATGNHRQTNLPYIDTYT